MAYNFSNLVPLFGGLPNANGATAMQHHQHQTYMNQLAATSLSATTHTHTTAAAAGVTGAAAAQPSKRDNAPPEPPPAPILGSLAASPPKLSHQNQGHAPMDLENDSEPETSSTPTLNSGATTTSTVTNAHGSSTVGGGDSKNNSSAAPLHMHEPNLYLNGLLSTPGMSSAAAYMFFPGAQTAAANSNASAANPMLMDATTAMMAAMQQHIHSYAAGYNMNADAGGAGVAAEDAYASGGAVAAAGAMPAAPKEVIKTKGCVLFPPNPNAPPPTIRDRPPGCRTVFVGGLPENISEEIIHEIFDPCGEITTLRMSKKNFCHIRYRQEASIDRAIYLSGYRVRLAAGADQANFGRLHVDYAQARDDQYEYECKQRQLQREQRHRERMSLDRRRSQSPPPMPHYTDHEASLVADSLRSNETFLKAIQTITAWLERGDCTKRNANVFYSMIQSTHAHVRRLHTDKQQLEDELRKARESHRKQMLTMSTQFTQIEKVFNAASHKKVWDHFTKAQRKNIDQWKKLATELRSVQIEDDEMEMSDDDRDYAQTSNSHHPKRTRYDQDSLKEENDSLRCQLEAIRNEMSMERTDIKYDSVFREKQIKVLQETIRNLQTQLMQSKIREQKDGKALTDLEGRLREAGVKLLLLNTKVKETQIKLKEKEAALSSVTSETGETLPYEEEIKMIKVDNLLPKVELPETNDEVAASDTTLPPSPPIIDIDVYKSDDDVKIIEEPNVENCTIVTGGSKLIKTHDETEPITLKRKKIETTTTTTTTTAQCFMLNEAKVIALTAAYLVVQPFGVKTSTICAYLNRLMQSPSQHVSVQQLADTLSKYGNLFETKRSQSTTPTTATAGERKEAMVEIIWKFCGFQQAKIDVP